MLSEVPYFAFLAYSPRGTSDTAKKSRRIMRSVKTDGPGPLRDERMITFAVRRLAELRPPGSEGLLDESSVLVPIPSSRPFPPGEKDVLWVPKRICEDLVRFRLGGFVLPCLKRIQRVPKAAHSTADSRPQPLQHLDSLQVDGALTPGRITLVDDVITQGSTALAAASLITERFPACQVGVVALLRTRGLVDDIDQILDPVSGWVRYENGRAWRDQP